MNRTVGTAGRLAAARDNRRLHHVLYIQEALPRVARRCDRQFGSAMSTMSPWTCGGSAARGCHYCTVGGTSSNLISDAFYRSRGFTPVRLRLRRKDRRA